MKNGYRHRYDDDSFHVIRDGIAERRDGSENGERDDILKKIQRARKEKCEEKRRADGILEGTLKRRRETISSGEEKKSWTTYAIIALRFRRSRARLAPQPKGKDKENGQLSQSEKEVEAMNVRID